MRHVQKRRSDSRRRGNVAIEYALMLPMLLLLILGIMDTGRFLWTYTTLSRAVEAAARCAAVNTNDCGTDAQIQNSAVREAWGLSVDSSNFVVTRPPGSVQVQTAYNFTFAIPGFYSVPLGTIALNARARYPWEPPP